MRSPIQRRCTARNSRATKQSGPTATHVTNYKRVCAPVLQRVVLPVAQLQRQRRLPMRIATPQRRASPHTSDPQTIWALRGASRYSTEPVGVTEPFHLHQQLVLVRHHLLHPVYVLIEPQPLSPRR